MSLVRMCHPHNYKDIYEFDGERETFTGPVGDIVNDILSSYKQYFRHALPNSTFEIHPNRGIGDLDEKTQRFNGCLGEMQSNQSDFIFMLFEYPFDAVNITGGLIAYETFLVIGGMYDQVSVGGATQFLDSFAFFTPFVWFNCLLMILSIFLVLKTYNTLRQRSMAKRRYNLYAVVAHCTGYGSIPANGLVGHLLFIVASLFSLIVLAYFSSSISTQLVIIKEPLVYHTYQQVIDRKAVPLFIRGMAYDQFFKKPTASPLRKKFWRYAVENFNVQDLYVDIDPIALLLRAMKMVLREAVMIMEAPLMPVLPGSGCPIAAYNPEKIRDTAALIQDHKRLKPLMEGLNFGEEQQKFILDFTSKNPMDFSAVPDFNFHISTDPQEEKFSQSILLADNSDVNVHGHLIMVNRRLIESGYPIKTMRRIERYNLLAGNQMIPVLLGTPNKKRKFKVENCFSESVLLPEAHIDSVAFENLWSLMLAVGSAYCLIGLLLIAETFFGHYDHKRRSKMRRKIITKSLLSAQFVTTTRRRHRHSHLFLQPPAIIHLEES